MEQVMEKLSVVRACQCGFHFTGQCSGFVDCPLWQQAGVHHEERSLLDMQRLMAKPIDQPFVILCLQDFTDRIFRSKRDELVRRCQEEQVVVAEYGSRGATESLHVAQDTERMRAAIDKITDKPEAIDLGVEIDMADQSLERAKTALHVADCVGGHFQ